MGCNSHIYAEIKHSWPVRGTSPAGYSWDMWGEIPESRDYNVYAALAGVRAGWPEPVAEKRGLPQDVGYEVKEEFEKWGCDFHSTTWLTPAEFNEALSRIEKGRSVVDDSKRIWGSGPFLHKPWVAARLVINALVEVYGEDNVRLVIAFDN